MRVSFFKNIVFITILCFFSCGSNTTKKSSEANQSNQGFAESVIIEDTLDVQDLETNTNDQQIITGANQAAKYLPLLKNKKVGVVANQTSIVDNNVHLVDFLVKNNISVQNVYAPEHGFRGKADAGEFIKDGVDVKTGVQIISIYGKNKKPFPEQLKGIDIMVFDIQDVGARFYTYISTLHYVMEACAEANIPIIVLDRPNPNGHYIDGPILEKEHTSFVGMHPIPIVHGMTIGEYAQMINGQAWMANKIKCDLTVIPLQNYNHKMVYQVPIKPSPNLPNDVAINLYPSLCFFEGTKISAGRGTQKQFQQFGAPWLPSSFYKHQFTPQSNEGAKHPKFKGQVCQGKDLSNTATLNKINLEWLIEVYISGGKKKDFFTSYFTTLAGTEKLQKQIEQGYTAREIRKTWLPGLADFDLMRKKYLLYK